MSIHNYRFVLLGDTEVGKSSIVCRFINKEYCDNREPTIGAGYSDYKCTFQDRTIRLEIWDTAGRERYRLLAPIYYRNSRIVIVVYDITKATTFYNAKSWVNEVQKQANLDVVIALVGNKIDLCEKEDEGEENKRQVSTEDAQTYADDAGLLFFETSARANINIDEIFLELIRLFDTHQLKQTGQKDEDRKDNTSIDKSKIDKKNILDKTMDYLSKYNINSENISDNKSDDNNIKIKNDINYIYDIFLSHTQQNGSDLAMNIKLLLENENRKLKIFLDVDDLNNIHDLENIIKKSRNFILIITEGTLERPFIHKEIRAALKYDKNIILVHDEKSCPFPNNAPEDIKSILNIKAIPFIREHDFRKVSIKKIIDKLKNI